jgi:para-aminobenzoate synthetase / 4-amino-4-deoxychorismate lyase
MDPGICIISRDPSGADRWLVWTNPIEILQTRLHHEINPLLNHIDQATQRGAHALGFLSYESGPAGDPHFTINKPQGEIPLAWFALFRESFILPNPTPSARLPAVRWHSSESRTSYRAKIQQIKAHIAAGDTYQVNFTFNLHTRDDVNARDMFFALYETQPSPYAMYVETPAFQIASVSPELFFQLDGDRICCEPMKGTSPRGLHPALDKTTGEQLKLSEKNRAENIMIVDMVRNDLSRIAESGSVQVDELFNVTRWPTLWQMTSKVSATTTADMHSLFGALFPSASITGAPKLKTSEIIASLESSPRGVYTGAIGWWFPNRQARFAVAIRTAVRESISGKTIYGIGSGIVWDSDADDEYRECLLKSRILRGKSSSFQLIETLRWDPVPGFILLDQHIERMSRSAEYFGFDCNPELIRAKLTLAAQKYPAVHQRVRMLLDRNGVITIEQTDLPAAGHYREPASAPEMTAVLDSQRIVINSPFLYHKTTRRAVYDQARRRHPAVDEVLLVNSNQELMEFLTGNAVIRIGTDWLTPTVESGLLPGVFRDHLIAKGEIKPARLTISDLVKADDVYFINSVRGWRRIRMAKPVG